MRAQPRDQPDALIKFHILWFVTFAVLQTISLQTKQQRIWKIVDILNEKEKSRNENESAKIQISRKKIREILISIFEVRWDGCTCFVV